MKDRLTLERWLKLAGLLKEAEEPDDKESEAGVSPEEAAEIEISNSENEPEGAGGDAGGAIFQDEIDDYFESPEEAQDEEV